MTMKAVRFALILGLAAFAAPSFANMAPPPALNAEREIRAVDADMMAAVAAKDADKVASFYTDDAVILPPGYPPVTGAESIKKFWAGFLATPGLSLTWQLTTIKVSESGDLAVSHGPYVSEMGDATKTTEHGKSVVTWAMTDKGWRVYTDMFSGNGPSGEANAPPPTPEKSAE